MIIERVETFPLLFSVSKPYGDANGYKKYRSCYMIKVVTTDGVAGWGECIDWLPTLDTGFKARIIPFLVGKKATERKRIVQVINKWHQRAASAVSMALIDIIAKTAQISVCDLWGGRIHDSIPVYASFQSYSQREDWIQHSITLVRKSIEQGFQQVKVKVGGKKIAEDQQHIEQLLEAIDSTIGICLDANQSYDLSTAMNWKTKLQAWKEKGANFSWLEEPMPLDHTEQYHILRSELEVPIAGGENIISSTKFLALLRQESLDIVQPDCMHLPGIDEYIKTCDLSRAFGLRVSPHAYDGALSRHYAILVQACLPSWSKMEGEEIEPVEWDVMENPFTNLISSKPIQGKVKVPVGIGCGVEIDEERLQAYIWDGTAYH